MCCVLKWITLLLGFICLITCEQTIFLSCGRRKIKTTFLVRGGVDAAAGYWPWHGAVYYLNKYRCGGSIIDPNTILTASHCVYTLGNIVPASHVSVHVGKVHLDESNNHTQILDAQEIVVHPEYRSDSMNHDIALIKLSANITMNKYVQPVCLWTMDSEQDLIWGNNGTIVGFGLSERDVVSDQLKEALIQVVKPLTCIESDRDVFGPLLTWDLFCGIGKTGVSACNGDSGGGMVFEIRRRWFVRGLISFTPLRGNGTGNLCDPFKPTVYTDVAKYLDWIKQFIDQRILPYESNVFEIDYEEKLRLFNFDVCGVKSSTYSKHRKEWTLPWLGIVRNREDDFRCAITLINEWYAVGPANCIEHVQNDFYIILGGDYNDPNGTCFSSKEETLCSHPTQLLQIKMITKHPQFEQNSEAHNIALIEFEFPADTTQPNVKPICMPVTSLLRTNATTNLYAAIAFMFEPIKIIPVRYVEYDECERQLASHGIDLKLENNKLCWRKEDFVELKSCYSEMLGLPFQEMKIINTEEQYFLRGFNSFGTTCARLQPAVFLNFEPYLDWILYNMRIHTTETTNASSNATNNQTLESEWNMLLQQPGKEKLRLFDMDTCGVTSSVIQPKDNVPWVSILTEEADFDGFEPLAVLISEWFALAPKSIVLYNKHWRYIVLGKYQNNITHEATHQLVEIKNIIIPQPDHPTVKIALIELLEPADLKNPYIKPICMPFMERFYQLNSSEVILSSIAVFHSATVVNKNITTLDKLNCQKRLGLRGFFISMENYSCAIDSEGISIKYLKSSSPFQMHLQFGDGMRYFLYGMYDTELFNFKTIGMYVFSRIELADLEWMLGNMQEKERQSSFPIAPRNERVNLLPIQVSRSGRNLLSFSNCGLSSSSYPTPWIGTLLRRRKTRYFFRVDDRQVVTLLNAWYAVGPVYMRAAWLWNDTYNIIVFGEPCYKLTEYESDEANIIEACNAPTQRIAVQTILTHPQYDEDNQANSISLFRLATPANTSFPNVKPICLPIIDEIRSYDTSSLAMVSTNIFFSSYIIPYVMKNFNITYNITNVEDRYVDLTECQNRWEQTHLNITVGSFRHCVMTKRTSDDECVQIPPSAPLQSRQMYGTSERSFLRGLVLNAARYCSFYYPAVYVDTDAYLDWMLETMEPPEDPPIQSERET